jgi:hypothetical protein
MKRLSFLSILAIAVVAVSCGSGSDGGSKSNITAGFTPDEPNPGANTVSAAEGSTSGDLVAVVINVTDVADVYGAAFDLTYDPNMATYVGYSGGDLLGPQGSTADYFVNEPQQGELVVYATLLGDVPGVDAVGTVKLIELTFRVEQEGSSALAFQLAGLLENQDPDPVPILGISWSGGTLDGLP